MMKTILGIILLVIIVVSIGCLSDSCPYTPFTAQYCIEIGHNSRCKCCDIRYYTDNYTISDGVVTLHQYWSHYTQEISATFHTDDIVISRDWFIIE